MRECGNGKKMRECLNGKKGKSTTLSSKSYLIGIHSPSDRAAGQAPGQEEKFVLIQVLKSKINKYFENFPAFSSKPA
jgi:hypothetical protein